MTIMDQEQILVGVFGAPHGVAGLVRLKSYTQHPESIVTYHPLSDASGRQHYRLALQGMHKGMLLVRVEGVSSRTQAQALTGQKLYVPRTALPSPAKNEEEYYITDLIGCLVRTPSGKAVGTVRAAHHFGAGDILEITPDDGTASFMAAFTQTNFPEVSITERVIIYAAPEIV